MADGAGMATLARAEGITVGFRGRTVLDRVDLAVRAGEIVTLIGPNGSGKTTLIRVLLGLIEADAGRVERRPGIRIGYVPQDLQIDKSLPITVRRFLSLAGARGDSARRDKARRDRALQAALAEVGAAHLIDSPCQDLSGGEIKRCALARALVREPDLLVLDEPTANVDVAGQAEIYELIRTIRDRRNCGVLIISHDLHLVMAATDRVICLNAHICCQGKPEEVSRSPEYQALFGPRLGAAMAVYTHDHDHRHDLSGQPVRPGGRDGEHPAGEQVDS